MKTGKGIPPWHLWGGSEVLDLELQGIAEGTNVTRRKTGSQLAKVSYLRPESWHWFFSARLLSTSPADVPQPAGEITTVTVQWQVTIGIGRTFVTMENFDQFVFGWGLGLFPGNGDYRPNGAHIYSSNAMPFVKAEPTIDVNAQLPGQLLERAIAEPITELVAQDIQLQALVTLETNISTLARARVQVDAMFAPKTHIRPEWHVHTFPAAEQGAGVR